MRKRGRKRKKICLICDKEIKKHSPLRIVALDRPYVNLYTHRKCWSEKTVICALKDKKAQILAGKYGILSNFG